MGYNTLIDGNKVNDMVEDLNTKNEQHFHAQKAFELFETGKRTVDNAMGSISQFQGYSKEIEALRGEIETKLSQMRSLLGDEADRRAKAARRTLFSVYAQTDDGVRE